MTSSCKAVLFFTFSIGAATAQPGTISPTRALPAVHFVSVDEAVRLEVLDWGGTGASLVLLAGSGNTAHIYEEFAPQLTGQFHVYGITRRGYGASSAPPSGYTANRLGDDVIAVLDALKLTNPILVGHSLAGEELSSVATRHPSRVSGVIYLDAALPFAYQNPAFPEHPSDFEALQAETSKLAPMKAPSQNDVATIPIFQKWLG